MLKTVKGNRQGVYFCLAVLFVMSVHLAWGYEDRGRGGQYGRDREENPRREQMRQEAQASVSEIKTALTQVLEAINQNQRPDEELITKAATMLEENKRYAAVYDDAEKAQYMLLQAWTDFYQDKLLGAMNWSLRACKTDESNSDAWISQAMFCMLSGKRPIEPRVQPPQRTDRNNDRRRGRVENEPINGFGFGAVSQPYGQQGTLEFDLSALRADMLNERFSRSEYHALGGAAVEYKPGEDTLCILFWQEKSSAADANDLSGTSRRAAVIDKNSDDDESNVPPELQLENQRQYLENIYHAIEKHPEITCFSLNTNNLEQATKIASGINENFMQKNKVPIVFAADPESGARAYVEQNAERPFLLIVDKKGVVRYAGPAANFMPAFILTHLTGVDIPLKAAQENKATNKMDETRRPYMPDLMPEFTGRPDMSRPRRGPNRHIADPNAPVADPNQPAGDPNSVAAGRSVKKKVTAPVEIPLEDQIKADHLLELAREQIEASRTIRGKSPAQGIEACKTVLEKYPNTEYAERAREQLRRVPERYWEKYGIADLLGY